MKVAIAVLCIWAIVLSGSMAIANQKIVTGVYNTTLITYTKEGRKTGVIKNVSTEEIQGTPVLGITSRNLVGVKFRGEEMWLRASRLSLSVQELPPCPPDAPGISPDTTTPVSSGMGPKCKKR